MSEQGSAVSFWQGDVVEDAAGGSGEVQLFTMIWGIQIAYVQRGPYTWRVAWVERGEEFTEHCRDISEVERTIGDILDRMGRRCIAALGGQVAEKDAAGG